MVLLPTLGFTVVIESLYNIYLTPCFILYFRFFGFFNIRSSVQIGSDEPTIKT